MKALVAGVFLASLSGLAVTDAQAQSTTFHCYVRMPQGTAITFYSSSVIEADLSASQKLGQAFADSVNKTYGLGLAASAIAPCDDISHGAPTPDQSISATEAQWKAKGATVVRVSWTPPQTTTATAPSTRASGTPGHRISDLPVVSPPPSAPATPAAQPSATPVPAPPTAAAPAPPSTSTATRTPRTAAAASSGPSAAVQAYHCVYTVNRGEQLVRYSSGVIQTSASMTTLVTAWRNELATNQSVADAKGSCTILTGPADQRDKSVTTLEQNWKKMNNQVIHIEWTTAPRQIK